MQESLLSDLLSGSPSHRQLCREAHTDVHWPFVSHPGLLLILIMVAPAKSNLNTTNFECLLANSLLVLVVSFLLHFSLMTYIV